MATKKKPTAKKKAATKKTAAKKTAAKKPAPRKDLGAPVDVWFAKVPPQFRPLVDALRAHVEAAAPDAASSVKWGNAFYTIDGKMYAAMTAHKAHVNLIFSGPSDAFDDPSGRLSGASKLGRHIKLSSLDDVPTADVKRWLKTAASMARKS